MARSGMLRNGVPITGFFGRQRLPPLAPFYWGPVRGLITACRLQRRSSRGLPGGPDLHEQRSSTDLGKCLSQTPPQHARHRGCDGSRAWVRSDLPRKFYGGLRRQGALRV